jgi:hypothetical protein
MDANRANGELKKIVFPYFHSTTLEDEEQVEVDDEVPVSDECGTQLSMKMVARSANTLISDEFKHLRSLVLQFTDIRTAKMKRCAHTH